MSDATDVQGGTEPSGDTPPAEQFTPITSQDDLNKVISDRLARERAKYADYRDLKAKASKLDELEAANKTESEKAAERLSAAEREAAEARADSLRFRIAAKFEVSEEDADLFLTGTDEETLTRQAKRLTDRTAEKKKAGNHVPREGTSTAPAQGDPLREFTEQLFAPRA